MTKLFLDARLLCNSAFFRLQYQTWCINLWAAINSCPSLKATFLSVLSGSINTLRLSDLFSPGWECLACGAQTTEGTFCLPEEGASKVRLLTCQRYPQSGTWANTCGLALPSLHPNQINYANEASIRERHPILFKMLWRPMPASVASSYTHQVLWFDLDLWWHPTNSIKGVFFATASMPTNALETWSFSASVQTSF